MSSHSSFSYSSSSYSYSSSISTQNGQRSGQAYYQTTKSNPQGTTVNTRSQNLGQPMVTETRKYDSEGRQILEDGRTLGNGSGWYGNANANRRIEDVSDDQKERNRQYEERMEDEYAKREGGA
ncbi:hypothetical protein BDZ45DRAFT_675691 [Acephala macrosclerotiorum]|nr:hypothetical protein BDZ45DRAFT_675691 [Acephala macrosclerotiorum]